MLIRPLSARERRLIALLILAALGALLWFALAAPILDGFAQRAERRSQLRLRYAQDAATIAALPRLRRAAARAERASRPFRIEAPGVEPARDALKDRLQRAIEAADGATHDVADAEGPPGGLRARVSARLTPAQLAAVLAQLQNHPPWLTIESLSVSANDALVTGQTSAMDVQIEASLPFRRVAVRAAAAR